MLADFERPNIVVCVLCKGSVSVRKVDKTRFFNHISIDHEVHFDLDLFYAISLMSDREKKQICSTNVFKASAASRKRKL